MWQLHQVWFFPACFVFVSPIFHARSVFKCGCLHKGFVPFVCACVLCLEHSTHCLKVAQRGLVCVYVCGVFSHYLSKLKKFHRSGRTPYLFTATRKRNNMEWIPLSSQVLHLWISPRPTSPFRYLHGKKERNSQQKDILNFLSAAPSPR